VFGYPLSTAHTALLDRLTAVWSSPNLGSLTTRHEIVGGFLCSLTDLGGVLADKTTAQLETSRAKVEKSALRRRSGTRACPGTRWRRRGREAGSS
jgi:hypothetical protein